MKEAMHKTCNRCVMDTTAHDIWFDEDGECKFCKIHDELEKTHPLGNQGDRRMKAVVEKIKAAGKSKEYDCIVGVSGGRDSTYTLLKAVELGLRPLAVHFDNGWNTDISVTNIKNIISKFNITLHTVVADWEEFKDLQLSFLKASVPDADIPTDFAIYSVLYDTAAKEGVKYILNGHSFRTEGTSPISWSYMDPLYLKAVHRRFGSKKITSFPIMSMMKLLKYMFIKRVKEVRLMEFMDYQKSKVDGVLKEKVNWQYYGGHHHENSFTKFFQSYYLPQKFNIDKRKTELSALIRSGQITREKALEELNASGYKFEQEAIDYAINKLGLTKEEFQEIMDNENKSHRNYRTLLPVMRLSKLPIKIAARFKLVPSILYLKYAKSESHAI